MWVCQKPIIAMIIGYVYGYDKVYLINTYTNDGISSPNYKISN